MNYIYPAKSLNKYKIDDTEIIVIGEQHYNEQNTSNTVGDFIIQYMLNGYKIHLELPTDFHKYTDDIIKFLKSDNIVKVLQIAKNKNKINEINGIDFRRDTNFFGAFMNRNVQADFFSGRNIMNINFKILINVISNVMIFVNKNYYNPNIANIIKKINPNIIDDLFFAHNRANNHLDFFKQIIHFYDTHYKNVNMTIGEIENYIKKNNINISIKDEYVSFRSFILLFTDTKFLLDMLFSGYKKNLLLIGEGHTDFFKKYLSNYITYPYNHPKSTDKEKKIMGKEIQVNSNKVFIKYLK